MTKPHHAHSSHSQHSKSSSKTHAPTVARIAVYWNFEYLHVALGQQHPNVQHRLAYRVNIGAVVRGLAALGRVHLHRAYANWTQLQHYSNDLQQHDIEAIQLFYRPVLPNYEQAQHNQPVAVGNGAALRISVDLMDDLHQQQIDTIVLIGGNHEYIPAVQKARQRGCRVYGIGVEMLSTLAWQQLCHQFYPYHALVNGTVAPYLDLDSHAIDAPPRHAMNTDAAYDRYLRLLKEQQIRLIAPHTTCIAIEQAWQIFADVGYVHSFDVFRAELKTRMHALTECSDTELAKIKTLLYKSRFFAVDPAHSQIRLDALLLTPQHAIRRVQHVLVQRVLDHLSEAPDLHALRRLLPDGEQVDLASLMKPDQSLPLLG